MSPPRSAICLVIDRLSAAYVGALGNTWIRTPAFDALTAESIVFDRAMVDSPALEATYRSYWTGAPAWFNVEDRPSIAEKCRQLGLPTLLVTDADQIADHELAAAFDEVVRLPPPEAIRQADDWQATQLAAFFAAAIEVVQSRRPAGLVWLHTGALGRVWDSPQELRAQYADEDDPEPPALVQAPALAVGANADADSLLGLRHAYAGEVSLLDDCLGVLMETIANSLWREALFSLMSPRGFPLGEHGTVGVGGDALYGELVRVPWLLRVPNGPKYGLRSDALVQPVDLLATLCQWFGLAHSTTHDNSPRPLAGQSLLSVDQPTGFSRDLALARAPSGETALMTAAWFALSPARGEQATDLLLKRGDAHADDRRLELYVKPDDFFEVNEISDRCHDVAGEFRAIVDVFDRAMREGDPFEISLSDALLRGIEASQS